jgi:hypothetical protein
LDFPLISYCKHICAVQELFDELGEPQPHSPNVPTLSQLSATVTIPVTSNKPNLATVIAEKLERLAARLRIRRKDPSDDSLHGLEDLEATLDAMLVTTDDNAVLPSRQQLAPVVKGPSARQVMMPRVKTRKAPAGDPAYGGGQASGSKAKKTKLSKAPTAPLPEIPNFSTPLLTPTQSHSHYQSTYSSPYYQPTTSMAVPQAPQHYPNAYSGLYPAWPHPTDRS